jgi:hypothetical protein
VLAIAGTVHVQCQTFAMLPSVPTVRPGQGLGRRDVHVMGLGCCRGCCTEVAWRGFRCIQTCFRKTRNNLGDRPTQLEQLDER